MPTLVIFLDVVRSLVSLVATIAGRTSGTCRSAWVCRHTDTSGQTRSRKQMIHPFLLWREKTKRMLSEQSQYVEIAGPVAWACTTSIVAATSTGIGKTEEKEAFAGVNPACV